MISVESAIELINSHIPNFDTIRLSIDKCYGKVLAQDILSERDQPPFHRVAMDGVAIDFDKYQKGKRKFNVAGIQKAGVAPLTLNNKDECLEVMTGAVLPYNASAVIRYEDTKIENGICHIHDELTFNMMNNVHQKGSDNKSGDLLLSKGTRLYGPQIGIIASNGYKEVIVLNSPKIAVISTGDELVDLDETPLDFQIRRSNSYAIKAQLNFEGFKDVNCFHLLDDRDQLFKSLGEILNSHDVLVLSGGVSMGKYDFLPQVFSDLKVKKVFHNISQRPGKPLWFGATSNKLVFALPGNPVSAITCLRRYVSETLKKYPSEYATLETDFEFNKDLTYFLPVTITNKDHLLIATPIINNGSGDYGSLGKSDGFIELAKDKNLFKKGESFKLFRWNS